MSKIIKFNDFINEKMSNKVQESITVKNTGEKDDWSRPLYKDINTGRIYVMVDGEIHGITPQGEPLYPIKDVDIIEDDIKPETHLDEIASEIEAGETSGLNWDLEVKMKDWLRLEDEDIDMIANLIRNGEIEGSDPIDWKLDLSADSFDVEEEEEVYDDEDYDDDDDFDYNLDTDEEGIVDDEKDRYLSDADIEASYNDFVIVDNELTPDKGNGSRSGYITIEFPHNEDRVDNWIQYEPNGKIAFDHWYPENVYHQLVDRIQADINKDSGNLKETKYIKTFEKYTRGNIANYLDMDKSDFDDSTGLGDMADDIIDSDNEYDYVKDEVIELFDAFKDNNDISKYFTDVISKDFKYSRLKTMYNEVMAYYTEFETEYGFLENIGTPLFDNILKSVIKEFFKERNITEKKKSENVKMKKKKEAGEFYVTELGEDKYGVYHSDDKTEKCYFTGTKEKAEKYADKKNNKK